MPSWKKVILSGSVASLNSLFVTNGVTGSFTGSLTGTSSYSISSSRAIIANTASYVAGYVLTSATSSMTVLSASRALSASNADLLDNLDSTAYVKTSQTSSMSVLNASTASYATGYVLTSATSSMAVSSSTSASRALSASNADLFDNFDSAAFPRLAIANNFLENIIISKNGIFTASLDITAITGGTAKLNLNSSSPQSASINVNNALIITTNNIERVKIDTLGNIIISGSLISTNGITGSLSGSLLGTSSYATSASRAISASYVLNSTSASYSLNSTSASYVLNSTSASRALSASNADLLDNLNSTAFVLNSQTSSMSVLNAISSSRALSSSMADTASNLQGGAANYIPIWNTATSLSSSTIYQSAGKVGIGTTTPNANLDINGSLSNGFNASSSGQYSHAEGSHTIASGQSSHAEGTGSLTEGSYSHAEGYFTTASGDASHAEGYTTKALSIYSHAEGYHTIVSGYGSHAEGYYTTASGNYSHAEGYHTIVSGYGSHAEGYYTTASGQASHAEGYYTIASGQASHAEGLYTTASGNYSHTEGYNSRVGSNKAYLGNSYNLGTVTIDSSYGNVTSSFTVGSRLNYDDRNYDDFFGKFGGTIITRTFNGTNTIITVSDEIGDVATEGIVYDFSTVNSWVGNMIIYANYSHAEGYNTWALGAQSHTEGWYTKVTSDYSHAEGQNTLSSGYGSHAEGQNTTASGNYSHAEGYNTIASGYGSHAEGYYITAFSSYQHVQGVYNISSSNIGAFIHGNGTSTTSLSNLIYASGSHVHISGSLIGHVSASLITSNTASLDFNRSSFYTVALTNSVTTHISASNISPGQTVNVKVTQGNAGTGLVTFSNVFKQPTGSLYTASAVANAVDILSLVTFDTSNVYMVHSKTLS